MGGPKRTWRSEGAGRGRRLWLAGGGSGARAPHVPIAYKGELVAGQAGGIPTVAAKLAASPQWRPSCRYPHARDPHPTLPHAETCGAGRLRASSSGAHHGGRLATVGFGRFGEPPVCWDGDLYVTPAALPRRFTVPRLTMGCSEWVPRGATATAAIGSIDARHSRPLFGRQQLLNADASGRHAAWRTVRRAAGAACGGATRGVASADLMGAEAPAQRSPWRATAIPPRAPTRLRRGRPAGESGKNAQTEAGAATEWCVDPPHEATPANLPCGGVSDEAPAVAASAVGCNNPSGGHTLVRRHLLSQSGWLAALPEGRDQPPMQPANRSDGCHGTHSPL